MFSSLQKSNHLEIERSPVPLYCSKSAKLAKSTPSWHLVHSTTVRLTHGVEVVRFTFSPCWSEPRWQDPIPDNRG